MCAFAGGAHLAIRRYETRDTVAEAAAAVTMMPVLLPGTCCVYTRATLGVCHWSLWCVETVVWCTSNYHTRLKCVCVCCAPLATKLVRKGPARHV